MGTTVKSNITRRNVGLRRQTMAFLQAATLIANHHGQSDVVHDLRRILHASIRTRNTARESEFTDSHTGLLVTVSHSSGHVYVGYGSSNNSDAPFYTGEITPDGLENFKKSIASALDKFSVSVQTAATKAGLTWGS